MGKHILFIDDDEAFLYLLERTCKKVEEVSQVSCATNGKKALDLLNILLETESNLPDVAFIDINMPVMDGFEFLKQFKEQREKFLKLKEIIPVVMLTSSRDSADKRHALSTGIIDKYIVKPSNIIEMNAIIREVLA